MRPMVVAIVQRPVLPLEVHRQRQCLAHPSILEFIAAVDQRDNLSNADYSMPVTADFLHPPLLKGRCVERTVPVPRIRFIPDVDQAFTKRFSGDGCVAKDFEAYGIEVVTASVDWNIPAPIVRVPLIFDVSALFVR